MAKVPLEPIGSLIGEFMDPAAGSANAAPLRTLNMELQKKRDDVKAGWGPEYVDRVHEKGRLTTWERIERLKDPDSRVLPVGTLVNYGITFGDRMQTSPGAGVSPRLSELAAVSPW